VPVKFEKGTGETRDFSTSGVYFETDHLFSPPEPIDFFMNLEHADLGPQGGIRCLGEVVRVEPLEERTGVAVVISSFGVKVLREPEQG
jgi:hypothetical protein